MQDKRTLLIFPYNGNGIEALDCIGDSYRFIGFVDDTPEKQGMTPFGYPVYGREAFERYPNAFVLAVPGSPDSYLCRQAVIRDLNLPNRRFATVIHPSARVSAFAIVGFNVLIMAGAVLTSNAEIGSHTCILPNTVIHHDVKVGDWTLIGSNVTIAGNTVIENNCYIGSGATIMNGLRIGAKALVGLGSNVISNVEQSSRVVGNPARVLAKTPLYAVEN
jgi:sugar O-acyltransferase (sialic acid O-acetyltransferase NeuD family)